MKKTLLKLVQDILAGLDGEEVNSIADTVESRQIVTFIRNSYEELLASLDLPETYGPITLNGYTAASIPVVMTIPGNVLKVNWIKYNSSTITNPEISFREVRYMEVKDFFERMYGSTVQDTTVRNAVLQLNGNTINIFYHNDQAPQFYTVLDNTTVLFDSYDSSVDTTLHSSKLIGFGQTVPQFVEQDTFVPQLAAEHFPLLENEAKRQAFAEQKQTQSPIAEQRARKGWIRSQRTRVRLPNDLNYTLNNRTNYGRISGSPQSLGSKSGW